MGVIVYEQLPDPAVDGFDGAVWLWSVQGPMSSNSGELVRDC